jgi:hypothetical protein
VADSFANRREEKACQNNQRDQTTQERLILGNPTPYNTEFLHAAQALLPAQVLPVMHCRASAGLSTMPAKGLDVIVLISAI